MSSYAISSVMPRMYAQSPLALQQQQRAVSDHHLTAANAAAPDNSWLQAAAVALPREIVAPGRPSTQRRPAAEQQLAQAAAQQAQTATTAMATHVETSLDNPALFIQPAQKTAAALALPPAETQLRQQRMAPVRLAASSLSLTPQTTAALYARSLGR